MANNTFYAYSSIFLYNKYDIVRASNSNPTLYFSTMDLNSGYIPLHKPSYTASFFGRQDNLGTLYFSSTGLFPDFQRGSLIETVDYTGMVLNAGSGFVQFLSPGVNSLPSAVAWTINGLMNPAWTTGFNFLPSYSTSLENTSQVIEAQLGDGYSQRARVSLNNNINMWKLAFQGRSDKETLAIQTFIEEKGGVDLFQLLMPVGRLTNNPSLKYISKSFSYSTQSYNINDASVDVVQVFDIS